MSFRDDKKDIFITAQGKSLSFEQIYLELIKPVYYVAYGVLRNKEDAEDIAHDVFLTFFQMDDSNRIRNIKDYLLKMSRNKALNYLKKKNREELTDDFSAYEDRSDAKSGECGTGQIEDEVNRLPLEERQIFIMHVKAGLKFRQIAGIMEMPLQTVHRRYKSAIMTLQLTLKKDSD